MKKMFGKLYKSFLYLIIFFICAQGICCAYETVLIDFPNNGWHKVFYQQKEQEIIGQYVPSGQDKDDYSETVILHSYKWAQQKRLKPLDMLEYHLQQARLRYKDMKMAFLKNDNVDTMAVWCSESSSQCEIIRAAQGYEGLITMHYVNRDPKQFQEVYSEWFDIMKNIKIYYSYYRWNQLMNKDTTIEL